MARKHSISPNQTVLWAYEALAPEWGSPALAGEVVEVGERSRGVVTTGGRASATVTRRVEVGWSVSALTCSYSGAGRGAARRGRPGSRRSVRHHGRTGVGVDQLV
jgi:hypothetical protein